MIYKRELPSARAVQDMYPMSADARTKKQENDRELAAILRGESDRFLLMIGPCSADREDAVLEYVDRLRTVQEKVRDSILILPRIYTNKPRTTGDGYKGMLHQPDPSGLPDMLTGLINIRKLHVRVIAESGFSSADEMLYPDHHPYLADCLSYVAVGARSVENQLHRLTASGLDIPVGMKNPTSGDLTVMMNAIHAAQRPHTFIYSGWEVESKGNPLAHAILRGYADRHGNTVSNYRKSDLEAAAMLYEKSELCNPAIIVDCNHANSGKNWENQPEIAMDILQSRRDPALRRFVKGLMVESYLLDGRQDPKDGIYGKSITDGCIGWEKTERLIYQIAESL